MGMGGCDLVNGEAGWIRGCGGWRGAGEGRSGLGGDALLGLWAVAALRWDWWVGGGFFSL